MPHRWIRLIGWLAVLLLAAWGYYQWRGGDLPWIDESEVKQDLEQVQAIVPEREVDSQRALLRGCVGCLNRYSDTVAQGYRHYLSWVGDRNRGPLGNERRVAGLLPLPDPQACLALTAPARDSSAIAAAWTTYQERLGRLASLVEELHGYYAEDRYRADRWAEGRRLHGPLMLAFEGYFAADRALRQALWPSLLVAQQQRPQAWLRQDPRGVQKLFALGQAAQRAMLLLRDAAPPDRVAAAMAQVHPLRDSLQQAQKGHSAWQQRLRPDLARLLPPLKRWQTAMYRWVERRKSEQPFDATERMLQREGSAYLVRGSEAACLYHFRRWVEVYHALDFHPEQPFLLVPLPSDYPPVDAGTAR